MPMPSRVKWAVAGLVAQSLVNGLLGFLSLMRAIWEADYGYDHSDLADVLVLIFLALLVVSLLCALGVALRRAWMRVVTVGFEVVAVLVYGVSIVSRTLDPSVLGAIALAVGVLTLLGSATASAWFAARRSGSADPPAPSASYG